MKDKASQKIYDFVIIGSGFGGSVSAMRLVEKGYSVLVLERGKRYEDSDFAKSNWAFWKYLWNPAIRSFGILQMSMLGGMLILHGSGLGGGSLGYANVLMEPDDDLFEAAGWKHLADWKKVLRPHFDRAKSMLGVAQSPRLFAADENLKIVAENMERGKHFRATQVGVYFDEREEGRGDSVDPYFGGEGPLRMPCIHCGACMVGCRHNAKNTLMKNYLYFAEKQGALLLDQREVTNIESISAIRGEGASYKISHQNATALFPGDKQSVLARNVIMAAGVMGTLKLLFNCRDVSKSLPNISACLGNDVRTNQEALHGATARGGDKDFSQGVSIASSFAADSNTVVQPVRYPAGSSLMRLLAAPLIEGGNVWQRLIKIAVHWLLRPIDFLRAYLLPGWAQRTTILLIMQKLDSRMKVRLSGKSWSPFRRKLISEQEEREGIPASIELGSQITHQFADQVNGIAAGSFTEGLLGMPSTAHILGGCPMGENDEEGVVDVHCEMHNYAGLFVVDGSIMPANPGINPSLTITALAEYAMSKIPEKQ